MAEPADPLVTVVIPTFRRPSMLRRAIASAVTQDSRVVVCVYDNGADAATHGVVAEFAGKGHAVRYHAHAKNIGANANFAYGLAQVRTPFFVILSDDDLLLPGMVDRAMRQFDANPKTLFVASAVLLVEPGGRVLRVVGRWPSGLYDVPRGLINMAAREHFTWTGTVFRRTALELAGSLDPEMGLLSDLDLLLRIAARGSFAVVDEPGAIFAWHPDSNSSLPTLDQFWPGWQRIAERVRSEAAVPQPVAVTAADRLERRLAGKLLLVGLFASSRGRIGEARAAAELVARPFHRPVAAALILGVAWLAARSRRIQTALHRLAWMVRWPSRRSMHAIQSEFDREHRASFMLAEASTEQGSGNNVAA